MSDRSKVRGRSGGAGRLVRNDRCFEFRVRYPWGISAISGYRRAARHFGLHTLEAPAFEGSDAYRVFIDASAAKLRAVATELRKACALDDGGDLDPVEDWLLEHPELISISHDWKHWDSESDEGPLAELGWKKSIVQTKKGCRVTLTLRRAVRRSRASAPPKTPLGPLVGNEPGRGDPISCHGS